MKIALIGYGKMGRAVEEAALQRGHAVCARLSSIQWDTSQLSDADLCIEFTQPEYVLENAEKAFFSKKPLVIGTTGWYDKIEQLSRLAREHDGTVLYSPNFSIGVNLFFELVKQAARSMERFREYGVVGSEYHHAQKKDAPSGTALELAGLVSQNMPRLKQFEFVPIRSGSFPGTHTLLFDSPADTITLSHEARNRSGFATGAVYAGEWLLGKKGLFTFADCMQTYPDSCLIKW
jgi:4-hydroxy-tetrahydrodipicolinate reductase